MTKDEIVKLAREAGMPSLSLIDIGYLEHFAALVAAEVGIAQWKRGYAEGQAAEREACAQVCDAHHRQYDLSELDWCAKAIRARSQA